MIAFVRPVCLSAPAERLPRWEELAGFLAALLYRVKARQTQPLSRRVILCWYLAYTGVCLAERGF